MIFIIIVRTTLLVLLLEIKQHFQACTLYLTKDSPADQVLKYDLYLIELNCKLHLVFLITFTLEKQSLKEKNFMK